MPAPTKSLRNQGVTIRKDKSGLRRSSVHSSIFDGPSVDTTVDRRRRSSARSNMRRSSLSQPPTSFSIGPNILANGPLSAMQSSAGSQSPENLEEAPRTKTGRISTAKKGKPVHKCDDCGKVYTRNEHLKRHQLNHSTKSIPCDVPRCKRRFQRMDLLIRHKKEEHDIETTTPLTEDVRLGDVPSDVDRRKSSTTTYIPPTRINSSNWDARSTHSSPVLPESNGPEISFFDNPYSTWVYDSNGFPPTLTSSMAETFPPAAYDASRSKSPASATSSAPPIWPQPYDNISHRSRNTFSPTSTEVSTSSVPPSFVPPPDLGTSDNYFEAQDIREDAIITAELGTILSLQDTYGFQPHLASLDRRYLDAYWHFFDPVFSVFNRFTFEASDTSPLVKALMIALGAYHLGDQAAQTLSRNLRETCSKLLHARMVLDYNHSRLCDLQAVFLFEAFSVFCSRRPHRHFSQRFEDLLVNLISDHETAFYTSPLGLVDTSAANAFGVAESSHHFRWVHLESKRRLLLACYTLEVQQNLFFESHRPVSDKNLPVPCSKSLWQAKTLDEWQYVASQESHDTRSLADVLASAYAGETAISDSFLLNVAIAHSSHSAMMDPSGAVPILPQSDDQSLPALFARDVALLAHHSPVFELLSVSGETFVLGQKLATQDRYHEAFEKLKGWAASGSALPALQATSRLFIMALQQDRVGLIYEDWALTLAGLVLWACVMWPQQHKIQGRVSPLPPHGIAELTKRAVNVASGQPEQVWLEGRAMSWGSARACLAFVRQRLDGRIGWLVQDACGVLGKLIDGRVVDDMHSEGEAA